MVFLLFLMFLIVQLILIYAALILLDSTVGKNDGGNGKKRR